MGVVVVGSRVSLRLIHGKGGYFPGLITALFWSAFLVLSHASTELAELAITLSQRITLSERIKQ
jgi:hypothetical protein